MRDIDEKAAALNLRGPGEAKPQNSSGSTSGPREPSTPASEDEAKKGSFVPFETRGALAIDATNLALNQRKSAQKAKDEH